MSAVGEHGPRAPGAQWADAIMPTPRAIAILHAAAVRSIVRARPMAMALLLSCAAIACAPPPDASSQAPADAVDAVREWHRGRNALDAGAWSWARHHLTRAAEASDADPPAAETPTDGALDRGALWHAHGTA
ncbi:MAG: hypothetical protein AAF772_16235, partial [Acidobacteriota bacterium]